MDKKFNPALVENARELRKNMTKEEKHLWYDFLKDYPVRFKKQKIIGNYIVDFYCAMPTLLSNLTVHNILKMRKLSTMKQEQNFLNNLTSRFCVYPISKLIQILIMSVNISILLLKIELRQAPLDCNQWEATSCGSPNG